MVVCAAETKPLFDKDKQTCVADYSPITGALNLPCVRITTRKDIPNVSYSTMLQKQGNNNFVLSHITTQINSEATTCDATYDEVSQIVRIPCISSVTTPSNWTTPTDSDSLYSVYMGYDDSKNLFVLIPSLEARLMQTQIESGTAPRRGKPEGGYKTLPDDAAFGSLMGRGGASGTVCRKADIKMSGKVEARVYTVAGEYQYTTGKHAPKTVSYQLKFYKSWWMWGFGWMDSSVKTFTGTAGNSGNTTLFTLDNLKSDYYYWCITGFLSDGSVSLKNAK